MKQSWEYPVFAIFYSVAFYSDMTLIAGWLNNKWHLCFDDRIKWNCNVKRVTKPLKKGTTDIFLQFLKCIEL